jgi:phenylalanine-4-hydroxylase
MIMSDFKDYNNIQVASLPGHLKQLTVVQQYNHYTPVDHAVWRFVMHQNYYYLKDVACYPYLRGLEKAGISPEKIPDLQEMNDALGHVNWGAVTVEGYIPPAMRMEFYAYRVMVVAPTIRKLEHIAYTPTSDIIHEAAGYAALITDDIYRKYLNYLGFISTKAICSAKDFELYDAIRQYEYLKEKPGTPHAELVKAERKVQYCRENPGELSEMALLSRLHWLTVEYGLVGSPEHPQIYGASLLASLSASSACLQPEVKKLPYTLDAIDYPFDSKQAPAQLFVTPDFQHLITVLEQFADTMAFRRGGAASILKAINCRSICTAVYSSGLQVSGVFTDAGLTSNDQLYFIKTSGPTALSVGNRQLQQQEKASRRLANYKTG